MLGRPLAKDDDVLVFTSTRGGFSTTTDKVLRTANSRIYLVKGTYRISSNIMYIADQQTANRSKFPEYYI